MNVNATSSLVSINVELQNKPNFEDRSEVPYNIEEADRLYDEIINDSLNYGSDYLKEKLRDKKRQILRSLQETIDAGFSDIYIAHEFKEGSKELQELAQSFNLDYSKFEQENSNLQGVAQALTAKIEGLELKELIHPITGAVAGVAVGDLLTRQLEPARFRLLVSTTTKYEVLVEKLFEAEEALAFRNSKSLKNMPGCFQEAIDQKAKDLVKKCEQSINDLDILEKRIKYLEKEVPTKLLRNTGRIVGGAAGLALELMSSTPAH